MRFRDAAPLKQAIAEVKKQYKFIQTGEKYVPTKNAENRNQFSILLNTFRHKIFNQCIDSGLRNYRCCQVFLATFYQECIACWKHICDEKSLQKKVKTYSIYFKGEVLLLLKFRTKNDELIILVFTEEVLPIIVQLKKKYQKKVRSAIAKMPSLIVRIKRCSLPKSLMDDIDYNVLKYQAKMYGPSIQQIVERYLIPEMNKPNVIRFKQPTYSTYNCTFITTCNFDGDENEDSSTVHENLKLVAHLDRKEALPDPAIVNLSSPSDTACNAPISDLMPNLSFARDTALNAPIPDKVASLSSLKDTACHALVPDPVASVSSLMESADNASIPESVASLSSPMDTACIAPNPDPVASLSSPMDTACVESNPDPVACLTSPNDTACNAPIPDPVADLTISSTRDTAFNASIPDPVAYLCSNMETACSAPIKDPDSRLSSPRDTACNEIIPDIVSSHNMPNDSPSNIPVLTLDPSADVPDNVPCNIPTPEKNQSPKDTQVPPGGIQTQTSYDLKNNHQMITFGPSELSIELDKIDKKLAEMKAKASRSKSDDILSGNSIETIQSSYSDSNLPVLGTCDIQKMCLLNSCCGCDSECRCITRKFYQPKDLNYIIVRLQLVLEPNKKNWKMKIRSYLYDSFFEETYRTGEFPKYINGGELQGSIGHISLKEIFKMCGSRFLLRYNCITVIPYNIYSSWMSGRWIDLDTSFIVYENCYERLSDTNVASMSSLELDQIKFENILTRLFVAFYCSKTLTVDSMALRMIALGESQGVPVLSSAGGISLITGNSTASSKPSPERKRCHSVEIQTDPVMIVPFNIDCIAGIRGIMNELAAYNDHLLRSLNAIYDTSFISRTINLQNATQFETNDSCINILSDRSVSILLKRTDKKIATFSMATLDNRIDNVFDGNIGWSNAEENAECYESLYYKKIEAAKIVTENDFPTSNVAKKKIAELVDETVLKNDSRAGSHSTPVLWITSKNLELATISSNPSNQGIYFVFNKNLHTKYCVDNIYFPHTISSTKIYNTKFGTFNTIATEVQRTSKVILRLSQCSTPFLIIVSDAYVFNTKIIEQCEILTQLTPINATPVQEQKKKNMESTSDIPMEMYGRDQRTRRQNAIKPPNFYTEHRDCDNLSNSSRNMPDGKKIGPVDEGRLDTNERDVSVKKSISQKTSPKKDTQGAFQETDSASYSQKSDRCENIVSNSASIRQPAKKRIRFIDFTNEEKETEQPPDTVVKNPIAVNTQIEPDVQMEDQSNSTDERIPETNLQLAKDAEMIQDDTNSNSTENCSWTIDNTGNYVNSKSASGTEKLNTRIKNSLPHPKRASSRKLREDNYEMFLKRKNSEQLHRNDASVTSNKTARRNLKQKAMGIIRLGGSPHSLGAGFLKQKRNLMSDGLNAKSSEFNKKSVYDSGSMRPNDNVEENVQAEPEVTAADAIEQHEQIVIDGTETGNNFLSKEAIRDYSSDKVTLDGDGAESNMEERLRQKKKLNEEHIGQDVLNNNADLIHQKEILRSNQELASKDPTQSKYATKNLPLKEHDSMAPNGHSPPVSNNVVAKYNLVNNESDNNMKTLVRMQDPGNNGLTTREKAPKGDQYAPVEVNIIIEEGKISQQIIYVQTSNGNNTPKQKIVDNQLVTMKNNADNLYEKCKLLNALALEGRVSMVKEVDKLPDIIDNRLVKSDIQEKCHADLRIPKIINVPTTSPYPLEMKELKPQISSDVIHKPDNLQDDTKNVRVNTLDTKNVQVNSLDTKKVETNQISTKVGMQSGSLKVGDVPLIRDIKLSPTSVGDIHPLGREMPMQTIGQPASPIISTQTKQGDINTIRQEIPKQTIVQPACTVTTTQTKQEDMTTLRRAMPIQTTGQPTYTVTATQAKQEHISTNKTDRPSFTQGSCLESLIRSSPQSESFQTAVKPTLTYPFFDTSEEESNDESSSATGIGYRQYLKENMIGKRVQNQQVMMTPINSQSDNSMAGQSAIAGPSREMNEQIRRNSFKMPPNIPCNKRPNNVEPECTSPKMPALSLISNSKRNVSSRYASSNLDRVDTSMNQVDAESMQHGSTGLIENVFPIYALPRPAAIVAENVHNGSISACVPHWQRPRPDNQPASLSSQPQQTPTSSQLRQRTQMSTTPSRFLENCSSVETDQLNPNIFQYSNYTALPPYFMNNNRHYGQAYQAQLPQNYPYQHRLQYFSDANVLGQEQFLAGNHNATNFARLPVQQVLSQYARNEPRERRYVHAPTHMDARLFQPIDLQRIRAPPQNIQEIFEEFGQFLRQPAPNYRGRIQSCRHVLPEYLPYPYLIRTHYPPDVVCFITDGSTELSHQVHPIPPLNRHHHVHRIIENRAGPSSNVMIPTPYNISRIMNRYNSHFSNAAIRPQVREDLYQSAPNARVVPFTDTFIESNGHYSVEEHNDENENSADV